MRDTDSLRRRASTLASMPSRKAVARARSTSPSNWRSARRASVDTPDRGSATGKRGSAGKTAGLGIVMLWRTTPWRQLVQTTVAVCPKSAADLQENCWSDFSRDVPGLAFHGNREQCDSSRSDNDRSRSARQRDHQRIGASPLRRQAMA